ncbi:MAG: 4-hydroxy-3-methylbut-2-enyl diphosphate reductase [Succinivibrionaceae bacterium]|nr:4-hydroxy-3-methylbut-2-enyl diphosphate reductase [Succinivibrionaceae bacterium]
MERTVYLANPRGFCAGVSRAISIVEAAIEKFGAPIYVHHEVVHNRYVVDDLRQRGAVFIESLDEVPDNSILIFSAHGVALSVENEAKSRPLTVFDATCPLVSKVHIEVRILSKKAEEVIMIGHRGHPEVVATLGQYTNDDKGIYLIERETDIDSLEVKDPSRLSYVTQTTLSIDESKKIIASLKQRYPLIQGPRKDDICYATQARQNAVNNLAEKVDLFIVVGSVNSSNSNRLRELASSHGCRSYLIDDISQIQDSWFDEQTENIGITAGASAPDVLIDQVVGYIKENYHAEVVETEGEIENRNFEIPSGLR